MWLYRHHTCNDIIDLDPASGHWRPVDKSEHPAGACLLADLPVRGSYVEVGDKRCYGYWTDDDAYVFQTSDGFMCEISRKRADGSIVEVNPGLRCNMALARYVDGRTRPGMSEVRIVSARGEVLHELIYNSAYYQRLHAFDFTAAAMVQDLSDWDFFVALQRGIEEFAECAASGRMPLTVGPNDALVIGTVALGDQQVPRSTLRYAGTGEPCPQEGRWHWVHDLRRSQQLAEGAPMPDVDGQAATWVSAR
jgi:hypothetical protein